MRSKRDGILKLHPFSFSLGNPAHATYTQCETEGIFAKRSVKTPGLPFYLFIVVQALETLERDPDKAGGEAFFIVDDSPHLPFMEVMRPFLESHGYRLTKFKIPYWVFMPLIILTQIVAHLLAPIYKINSVLNYKIVSNLYHDHWFTYAKAEKRLGYKPLFSYDEAVSRSKKYYDSI